MAGVGFLYILELHFISLLISFSLFAYSGLNFTPKGPVFRRNESSPNQAAPYPSPGRSSRHETELVDLTDRDLTDRDLTDRNCEDIPTLPSLNLHSHPGNQLLVQNVDKYYNHTASYVDPRFVAYSFCSKTVFSMEKKIWPNH